MKAVPLGELMVGRRTTVDPRAFPEELFEMYSIPAHDRGGPEFVRGAEIGSAKQLVQPGDVMISRIIPHIRRARVVGPSRGLRQIASGEWIVFRSERVEPAYFRHYLLSDGFHRQFLNSVAGVGGSLVRARPEVVRRIEVSLPGMSEQRRIAAILDKADSLRAKRRQALAHLDSLTQSIFHDMFGHPSEWWARWPKGTIRDMVESTQYGTSAKAGATGAWPVLRMGNITDSGHIDASDLKYLDLPDAEVNKYTVRRGDLLFNRTNSLDKVGKAAVFRLEQPMAFAGYLVRIRTKDGHRPEVISAYLGSDHGRAMRRRMAKAAVNQANINAQEVLAMPIAIFPQPLQSQFVARVEGLGRASQRLLADPLDSLFSSLQSRAFRGEL